MKYYTTKQGNYPNEKRQTSKDEYIGDGWSVKASNGTYILSYVSGSLQGELKTLEIDKEDFEKMKTKEIDLNQICFKYRVS